MFKHYSGKFGTMWIYFDAGRTENIYVFSRPQDRTKKSYVNDQKPFSNISIERGESDGFTGVQLKSDGQGMLKIVLPMEPIGRIPLYLRDSLTRVNLEILNFIKSQQSRTVRLEMYQAVITFCQEQLKHELEQLGENMKKGITE